MSFHYQSIPDRADDADAALERADGEEAMEHSSWRRQRRCVSIQLLSLAASLLLVALALFFVVLPSSPLWHPLNSSVETSHDSHFLFAHRDAHAIPRSASPSVIEDEEFDKPESDLRLYRGLMFQNGITVLCISDTSADKSSAAMAVDAGSWEDGAIAGRAHLLEHLLFMGSEDFPNEQEYSKFISEHNGQTNAYTSDGKTVYFFEIEPASLEPALRRFAPFFSRPLLRRDSVAREMLAVNNEHEKNLQVDEWRAFQLLRSLSNPLHPFSHFGTGSLETLNRSDVHEALIDFYCMHYRPEAMTLVLLGVESLDELEEMAHGLFSTAARAQWPEATAEVVALRQPSWAHLQAFPDGTLPRLELIEPIGTINSLVLFFPLVGFDFTASQSLAFVSSIIGDEGLGSILSSLQTRGFAISLECDLAEDERALQVLAVDIRLTTAGVAHRHDVLACVSAFLQLLRLESDAQLEARWLEWRSLQLLSYHLSEREVSIAYTSTLAARLLSLPLRDALLPPSRYAFDGGCLRLLLDSLRLDKAVIQLLSTELDASILSSIEPIYGTLFSATALEPGFLTSIKSDAASEFLAPDDRLALPPLHNPFLPSQRPQLLPASSSNSSSASTSPQLLNLSSTLAFVHVDLSFRQPKAQLYLDLTFDPREIDTVRGSTRLALWAALANAALQERVFAASQVGFSYQLQATARGLRLVFAGLSEGLLQFATLVAEVVHSSSPFDSTRFSTVVAAATEDLVNLRASLAYQQALYYLALIVEKHSFTNEQRLRELSFLQPQNFTELSLPQRWFDSQVRASAFGYGNVSGSMLESVIDLFVPNTTTNRKISDDAGANASSFEAIIASIGRRNDALRVPQGDWLAIRPILNAFDQNVAVLFHIPVHAFHSLVEGAALDLLHLAIKQALFDELRTKQTLGYIVASFISTLTATSYQYRALNIVVQGVGRSATDITQRVDAFLQTFGHDLQSMNSTDFEFLRLSLIAEKARPRRSLSEAADEEWLEIESRRITFDVRARQIAALRKMSLQEWCDFYDTKIVNINTRVRLMIQIVQEQDVAQQQLAMRTWNEKIHIIDEESRPLIKRKWTSSY